MNDDKLQAASRWRSPFGHFLVAGATTLVTVAAFAQAAPAAPAASMPMMDCSKMAKHDHGAEKGMPTPRSAACADKPAPAASSAKKKPLHDHGKVHKQQ